MVESLEQIVKRVAEYMAASAIMAPKSGGPAEGDDEWRIST